MSSQAIYTTLPICILLNDKNSRFRALSVVYLFRAIWSDRWSAGRNGGSKCDSLKVAKTLVI